MHPARITPLALSSDDCTLDARATRRLRRLLNPTPVFRAFVADDPERKRVESYIATRFREVHGAVIQDFMPVLLTMGCHNHITAAAGLRAAGQRPLFLEQYLSSPVEEVLAGAFGASNLRREKIAEIGNLVATEGGSSYLLFLVLSGLLEQAGFDCVVFTATPQVQKILSCLGLGIRVLCAANPDRLLGFAAAQWGSYYDSRPQVVAGRVAEGMTALDGRVLYSSILSLFRGQINELADVVRRDSWQRGTYILRA